uniref:PWWP domain-containing protein n=1 Tax=Cacopsylla melanoneura TaxID=428564 RepID=A0A8D9DWZ6_9HEMI
MCDLTTIDYQKGDVVWVKLGSLWWPGLVHDYDSLPEDVKADTQAFKKKPIAYVKFFQEENFEYVKDIHSIYQYNCLRKKEFIKKGLDMMRSTRVSTSNMQMFPCDVITAENLTQGDPKILERPEFTAIEEGGKNVYEDLFSSPAQKKLKKKKDGKDSSSPAIGFLKLDPRRKGVQSKAVPKPIGQHRLLNLSEDAAVKGYKSKELIQDLLSNGVHEKNFTCVECDYHCSRVNVMLLHYKGHSRHFDHKIKYPTGFKRKKKSNHSSGSGGVSKKMKLTNGDMNGGSKRVKNKAELMEQQKQEAEKLKQNFLMDWDEDENEDAEEEKEDSLDKTASKEDEKVSCFDFDDEEEEASPSKTNLSSFTARKRNYSKGEDSTTNTRQLTRSESTNGTKCYGSKLDDKSKESKCNLADEVDALLKETTVPTLPDIPKSKGGDAITLPPPVEAESGFGTLTSDLNESLDFRNDIVSKVTSTPATAGGTKPGKLSKQTLKTNYFKKVREEIAEVAKFEEEDQPKQDEDFEDEDMICDETETSGKPKETLVEETDATVKTSNDTGNILVEKPATELQTYKQKTAVSALPVTSGIQVTNNVSVNFEHVQNTTVELKTSKCLVRKTPEKVIETSPLKIKTANQAVEKTSPSMKTVKQVTDKSPVKPIDKPKDTSPNIVQIGNQTIHIPNRRNSKTSSDSEETIKTERVGKTEEDTLAEMMLVEEVDLGTSEPVYAKQAKPTSTVHIDMSPNKSTPPQHRATLKAMPTIIPIERSKYKPIHIPSSTTKQAVTVTPTKPPTTEEKYFILPNNQRIKTPSPAKSPVKSPIVLSSPDGGKIISLSSTAPKHHPQQNQLVYMSKPSTSNVPIITMKSTQKKSNLPVPGLRKLDVPANRLGTKTKLAQSTLQSKIKTIAHCNASQTKTSSPSQARSNSQGQAKSSGHIVVNQSTLPSILQQRRTVHPTRAPPPTLVPTPKLIEEAELLSEISNIPGTDASDAVVYLINNEQSQQILINSPQATQQSVVETEPVPSVSAEQTIYIDPNSTDLSNIYLTIDDDGNILNIVQKPVADPVVSCSDILAKALADTQVLQAECAVSGVSTEHVHYNNTYETSLTLNQAPIMSTSEAPSQVQHNSYFTNASVIPPLIEIKPNQENIQGMASPEIAYAPSDIQA